MFRFLARVTPKIAAVAKQPAASQVQQKVLPLTTSIVRKMSSTEVALTDEERDANWVSYFDNPELDYFDFCLGFNDLWQEDAVPEPIIMQSVLYACRLV